MSGTNGNAQDIESQGNPTENSPLLPHSADSSVNSSAATTPTTTTSHSHVEDPDGDFAKELEKPWPATFERSMMILAGPIMDEKSVDAYTKSPSVRNRYLKKNQKQGFFTPDASTLPTTPGTPAWLKKGLVRLKSLDYRFSDDDTAIFPGRMPQPQRFDAGMKQSQKKKDSHAYRMEVLKKTGGLRSAGNLEVEVGGYQYSQMQQQQQKKMTRDDEEDVTKSPGFRREKQIDRQRRKEKRREEEGGGGAGKERGAEGEAKGKDAHGHGVGANDHKSSFMQSTFNMANILMGVGMLGLPYVLKSAGWIGGTITTIGFCLVTWRTSYYLGRELNGDPRPVSLFDNNTPSKSQTPDSKATNGSHPHPNPDTHILQRMRKPITSFPGIAREAFGDNGCICLSAVLYFELFSCLSIFFVSLGDHLHALFPSISQSKHMTIAAGVLIVPSAVLRTPKLLSYLSAVGTVATVAVVSAVVLSALVMFILMMKAEHDIAGSDGGDVEVVGGNERDFTLYSSNGLPLALGIVAYCFSGHAIVPSIYSSMARPQDFERMIDVTYGMVLACCLLVGISGYYMFGNDVEDQITLSLENQSENGNTLMTMLTWLMILTAMSKFTLTMFPLALGFEEMLTGILPSDLAMELIDSLVKIVLIFLSLAVAIFFPSFSFLCSLVGLICTMIVSVIFPAMAHLKLFGSELSMLDKMIDWLLVAGGSIVAVVGTIATVQADA